MRQSEIMGRSKYAKHTHDYRLLDGPDIEDETYLEVLDAAYTRRMASEATRLR